MPSSNVERAGNRELPPADAADAKSRPYVVRWHHLVSCTNWEKGRIICEWRGALKAAGAPPGEYSDEAWSRRVGGVSPQHTGRLRRVFERFADVQRAYPSLYWSHFCAAIDWDDAEMWLEGAVQNHWSVAEMRAKRSEVLHGGLVHEEAYAPDDATAEDDTPSEDARPLDPQHDAAVAEASSAVIRPIEEPACVGDGAEPADAQPAAISSGSDLAADTAETAALAPKGAAVRALERVAELPDDLQEAFEQVKLAILRHKLQGWKTADREAILAVLDGLKQLVG